MGDGTLAALERRSGLSCGLCQPGLDLGWRPFRGVFHGSKVIAQWGE
jgi:hypothetical protein